MDISTIPAPASSEQTHNPKPIPGETIAQYMQRAPEQFTQIRDGVWRWNPCAKNHVASSESCNNA